MSPEAEAAYDALPKNLRQAALFALAEAHRRKTSMRWPTPKIIRKYAKMYDVSEDELAGCFGFHISRSGGYCAWVDTVRGAAGPAYFGVSPTNNVGLTFHDLSFDDCVPRAVQIAFDRTRQEEAEKFAQIRREGGSLR